MSRHLKGILWKIQARYINTGFATAAAKNNAAKSEKGESERMKKFREKLKSENEPSGSSRMQYGDHLLVGTDPKSGKMLANSETDPTKWGDWQTGGRVSDF